jgi:hypothetical protein
MLKKERSNKPLDIIIDSYWHFLYFNKIDNISFVRYTKGGRLIIDLDDFNACNVYEDECLFLDFLNHIKDNI